MYEKKERKNKRLSTFKFLSIERKLLFFQKNKNEYLIFILTSQGKIFLTKFFSCHLTCVPISV